MIRPADASDIPALLELGIRALSETNHPAKMDRSKTRKMIFQAIMMHRKGGPVRVWVADVKEKVVGVFIGQIDALYFAKEKYATDLIFYVLPRYRGHGIGLVKEFMRWAQSDKKVVDITLQMSSGINIEQTERLYKTLGFTRVGGCYVNYRGKDE